MLFVFQFDEFLESNLCFLDSKRKKFSNGRFSHQNALNETRKIFLEKAHILHKQNLPENLRMKEH